jgi:hypothetical protein
MKRKQAAITTNTSQTSAFGTTTQTKKQVPVYCSDNKHNTNSKTHVEAECWAVHPHLRDAAKNAKKPKTSGYVTTTASEHPQAQSNNQAQSAEDFAYATRHKNHNQNSIILDSGASKHMFNNISYFNSSHPTDVQIFIGSGAERNELTATRQGPVTI